MRSMSASGQLGLGLAAPSPRGRKRKPGRPRRHPVGEGRHVRRPRITRHQPVHVTLRTVPAARDLRRRDAYRAVQFALYGTFKRGDFRVCHVSLQRGHMHLIVEADGHRELARGMQGFQISAARALNRVLSRRAGRKRRGQVFADRYHARVQRSPRQMRNTIRYVLGNFRKHGADRELGLVFDPYSSAPLFDGFAGRRIPSLIRPGPGGLELLPVALPHSWLLSTGWRRHGDLAPP